MLLRRLTTIAPRIGPDAFSGIGRLTNRRLLRLVGLDAAKFLQGLTTNDVQRLHDTNHDHGDGDGDGDGQFSALLNAQSRVMFDVFVYRAVMDGDAVYFVECDGQVVDNVHLHLHTYNLRTRTSITMVAEDELHVAFSTGDGRIESAVASLRDTRADWDLKRHLIRAKDLAVQLTASSTAQVLSEGRYHRERVLRGIPEGAFEMQARLALPMEYNIDIMGGIDFHKGCYLGQELVIRTHHRGVVRKRVMPLRFHPLDADTMRPVPLPEPFAFDPASSLTKNLDRQSELLSTFTSSPAEDASLAQETGKLSMRSKTDVVGRVVMAQGNIGLGLLRLEQMRTPEQRRNMATLDPVDGNWVLADANIPSWWPADVFSKLQAAQPADS